MLNKKCLLCYGTGRIHHEPINSYIPCPDCGESDKCTKPTTAEKKPIRLSKKDIDCGLCYGTGKTFDTVRGAFTVCPNCNEIERLFNESPLEAYNLIGEALKIPLDYQGEPPVRSLSELGRIGNTDSYDYLDSRLAELYLSFTNRKPLRESFILSLSPHLDIDYIPYTLMQYGVERGLTVLPYITITELMNLQYLYTLNKDEYRDLTRGVRVSANNVDDIMAYDGVRLLKEFDNTYYDFIHTEVCFIKIPANPPANAFYALADLIQSRASKNLPTYVIAYSYPYTYKMGGLNFLIDTTGKMKLKKLTNLSTVTSTKPMPRTNNPVNPIANTGMQITDF